MVKKKLLLKLENYNLPRVSRLGTLRTYYKKYPRASLRFPIPAAGLTKIAGSIKTALDKIQAPAKKILEKIAAWFKRMFSSLVKKVTPGTKPVAGDKSNSSSQQANQPITVPFVMNGVDHTLYITVGSAADIEMASKKDRISNKIGRAVASLLQSGIKEDDPKVIDLKAIGKTASNIQKIVKTLKTTAGVTAASIGYTKLTSQISAYGKKYNVTDIDKSVVSDKTLQGGSRIVTVRGQKWNVPAGKSEKDIPAKDPIGDQLQVSAKTYGSQWSTDSLTENEKEAIKKATEKAKADGSWWKVNLLKNQAKGRWVEEQLRRDFDNLTWSRKGVDVFDIKTNLNYDILLGSQWNISEHAKRMPNVMFRYVTF
jgi:hypothetical protein